MFHCFTLTWQKIRNMIKCYLPKNHQEPLPTGTMSAGLCKNYRPQIHGYFFWWTRQSILISVSYVCYTSHGPLSNTVPVNVKRWYLLTCENSFESLSHILTIYALDIHTCTFKLFDLSKDYLRAEVGGGEDTLGNALQNLFFCIYSTGFCLFISREEIFY